MQNSDYTTPPKISPGCAIGVGVAIVALLIGVMFFFYNHQKSETLHNEAHAVAEVVYRESQQNNSIRIDKSTLSNYSPTDFGETLTAEHFIAVYQANDVTTLAREMFIDAATGRQIEWRLQLHNVRKSGDDAILAEFDLPYVFYRRNGSTGSSIQVMAKFQSDSIPDLANFRKLEWLTVSGKLHFPSSSNSRSRIEIQDATIISKP